MIGGVEMSETERMELIRLFRQLPVEKQVAFYFMTMGAVFVNEHESREKRVG